jgi:uroporphyrinogen-III decarboxylase
LVISRRAVFLKFVFAYSLACVLLDYDEFCLPYQQIVVQRLKAKHPNLPIIMYIKNSGALLERMAKRCARKKGFVVGGGGA